MEFKIVSDGQLSAGFVEALVRFKDGKTIPLTATTELETVCRSLEDQIDREAMRLKAIAAGQRDIAKGILSGLRADKDTQVHMFAEQYLDAIRADLPVEDRSWEADIQEQFRGRFKDEAAFKRFFYGDDGG